MAFTRKTLFELPDKNLIEAVLMRYGDPADNPQDHRICSKQREFAWAENIAETLASHAGRLRNGMLFLAPTGNSRCLEQMR